MGEFGCRPSGVQFQRQVVDRDLIIAGGEHHRAVVGDVYIAKRGETTLKRRPLSIDQRMREVVGAELKDVAADFDSNGRVVGGPLGTVGEALLARLYRDTLM